MKARCGSFEVIVGRVRKSIVGKCSPKLNNILDLCKNLYVNLWVVGEVFSHLKGSFIFYARSKLAMAISGLL